MLIDELTLELKAGHGGRGVVRWLHEKGKEFGGPAGGDGGKGGDVLVVGIRDIGALSRYRFQNQYQAESGSPGEGRSRHGKNGEDLVLPMPLGARITNTNTGRVFELLEEGVQVLVLKGGAGGYGNEHYKGSTNQNPEESTPGKAGEEAVVSIELRLIADVGLVGLPNAGKTSLLNVLTNAKGKVGSYAFTTLEPSLGECYGRIIADIPGLIEGAAEGRGLGDKFLRHIERTKVLFHCLSLEEGEVDIETAYRTVREELGKHNPELLKKREVILLTKSDTAPGDEQATWLRFFETQGKEVRVVSILDDGSVKSLKEFVASV